MNDKEFVLVSQGIEIMRTKSQEIAINYVKKENDDWFDYKQRCIDNYERYADNYISLEIEYANEKEKEIEVERLNNIIKEKNKQIDWLNDLIKISEKYFELITDLGYDHDGLNSVESLKSLIDELVKYAKLGRAYNTTKVIYENNGKKYNILHEEVKK